MGEKEHHFQLLPTDISHPFNPYDKQIMLSVAKFMKISKLSLTLCFAIWYFASYCQWQQHEDGQQEHNISSGSHNIIIRHGCLDTLLPELIKSQLQFSLYGFFCKWLWILLVLSTYHKSFYSHYFYLHYLPYCSKCLACHLKDSICSALIFGNCCCLCSAMCTLSQLVQLVYHTWWPYFILTSSLIPMLWHHWLFHGKHLIHCKTNQKEVMRIQNPTSFMLVS